VIKDGHGQDQGCWVAGKSRFNIYSSPAFGGKEGEGVNGTGRGYLCGLDSVSSADNATNSMASTPYANYDTVAIGTIHRPYYKSSGNVDTAGIYSVDSGLFADNDTQTIASGGFVAHHLIGEFSTDPGSYRCFCRMGASPYTTLYDDGSAQSFSGTDGVIKWITRTRAAYSGSNLAFGLSRRVSVASDFIGQGIVFGHCIEMQNQLTGYMHDSLSPQGGMTAEYAATSWESLHNDAVDLLLYRMVYLQIVANQNPMLAVRLGYGHHEDTGGLTAAQFAAKLERIYAVITASWARLASQYQSVSWEPNNLAFWASPDHPREAGDAGMKPIREGAAMFAAAHENAETIDVSEHISYEEMTSAGYFADSLHLTANGYTAMMEIEAQVLDSWALYAGPYALPVGTRNITVPNTSPAAIDPLTVTGSGGITVVAATENIAAGGSGVVRIVADHDGALLIDHAGGHQQIDFDVHYTNLASATGLVRSLGTSLIGAVS
jgi:hypothetical protein